MGDASSTSCPYRQPWMNDAQYRAAHMLSEALRGWHRFPYKRLKAAGPAGVEINLASDFATYDFDMLTRLVYVAHLRAVRVEISAASPAHIKLRAHARERDGEYMSQRHPTLRSALKRLDDEFGEQEKL